MRIMLVAGELSGDQLGGGIVRLLRATYPNAIIEGIGGKQMMDAGLNSLYPIETLSVMGFVEVIKNLPAILKVRRGILAHCQKFPPDIYIGIDAPDFNLPIELKLREKGIKTAHYVSPSVWAWREGRMRKIKKATDVMLAILPFEEDFYKKHNHKAVFVGHPLANTIPLQTKTQTARDELNVEINPTRKVIALMPGSRTQELTAILPIFLLSLVELKKQGYTFSVVLPLAKTSLQPIIDKHQDELDALNVQVINGQAHTVLQACDFALIASGTATLEAMLYKKPIVIGYRTSALNAAIVKRTLKTKFIGLPNILANELVIPELIQDNFTIEKITQALKKYFDDPDTVKKIKHKFTALHHQLIQNADQKVVDEITKLLNA